MTIEYLSENDFFKTSDLSLAGFLFLSYPLEAIDKQYGNKKAFFIFKRDKHIDKLMASFWRNQEKVEPQAYFGALRIIKTRLYSQE